MDLGVWLRSLGLEKYEAAFRENEIDETVLASLTHENLKELGVTALGHRSSFLTLSQLCTSPRTRKGLHPRRRQRQDRLRSRPRHPSKKPSASADM
jgi:SAM domain (Sterile alpha motif)